MLGIPNNFGEAGFPAIGPLPGVGADGNAPALSPAMDGTQFIYGLSQIISDLDENLTKTVGKHQMQFGGRYRHERFGSLPDEAKDVVDFGGNGTGLENPTSGTNYSQTHQHGQRECRLVPRRSSDNYSVNIAAALSAPATTWSSTPTSRTTAT